MRVIWALLLLIFLGATAIFAVQNTRTVTVDFLSWSLTAPLAVSALGVYILGMLTGWSVLGLLRRSIRHVREESRADRV
jgi:uncharacterized integral membrane protein